MKLPDEMLRRHAWWGTVLAALLSAVGLAAEAAAGNGGALLPRCPLILASVTDAALALILVVRRKAVTVTASSLFFALDVSSVLTALWIASPALAGTGVWSPVAADKVALVAVAMLAPRLWVGLSGVAGFLAVAIGRYLVSQPGARGGFLSGEPGIIALYALFALTLLVYRVRRLAAEREMLQVHAEAALAERLAQAFLAVRDFANTPIQTIAISVEVLRARCPELSPALDRIARSVVRLTELASLLRAYESHLTWVQSDVSFDPLARIAPPAARRNAPGRPPARTPPVAWSSPAGTARAPMRRR